MNILFHLHLSIVLLLDHNPLIYNIRFLITFILTSIEVSIIREYHH